MASLRTVQPDNVAGEFFVDQSCIDCGTCYELVPEVFGESADHARVHRQPVSGDATLRAEMALVACPTGSIGTRSKHDLRLAASAFPMPFEGPVSFCGYTSRKSFGAWSWLIRRPDGNVLVDSPRATPALMDRIEQMGGVRWLVLTHGDDLADHEAFARRFGCERIMHLGDVEDFGVGSIERPLDGNDPVTLADDLVFIPTPGHTRGHAVLLHADTWLFSGDHLWGSARRGFPTASRTFCWHSWERQLESIERLLAWRFRAILPGHGPVHRASDPDAMRADLLKTLADLRSRSPNPTAG
jgi:glyoxylase-like metal-dependent hydrolase (beta-lactamase superfamily II)/ferredoxin